MSGSTSAGKVLLEMQGIGKTFPGVRALEGVQLTVKEGQVHALLGENGAGKSTLIKILSGAYAKDEGQILFEGQPIEIRGPHDAQALGISTIYQEFNLARDLTVAENVFNGRIVRGGHGNAGEVGHLVVDPIGPRCGCGGRGHVESFAGGAGLARRARALWPSGFLRGDTMIAAPGDADGVFQAARRGDPDAHGLADDAADALAIALAAVVATLDPDRIVVGGSLGLRQRSFVRAAVQLGAPSSRRGGCKLAGRRSRETGTDEGSCRSGGPRIPG